jgi:hypothetical protein
VVVDFGNCHCRLDVRKGGFLECSDTIHPAFLLSYVGFHHLVRAEKGT